MSLVTAQGIWKYLKKSILSDDRRKIELAFYGGEPLLNPLVLEFFLDRLWQLNKKQKNRFSLVIYSNGTIIDRKLLEKFSRFKDKDYQISIDGNKFEHDRDRCGSWHKVVNNLKYIDRVGISRSAHPMIAYPYRFIEAYKNLVSLNFSFMWMQSFSYPVYRLGETLKIDVKLWAKNYLAFCDFYLDELKRGTAVFVMPLLGALRKYLFIGAGTTALCAGGGQNYLAIAVNGEIYPCVIAAGLNKFQVGEVVGGCDVKAVKEFVGFIERKTQLKGKCVRCPISLYCHRSCSGHCFQAERLPDPLCELLLKQFQIEIYFFRRLFRECPNLAREMLRKEGVKLAV